MLLIAIVLVGAAVALLFIGRANAEPYILALLAVLAMVGVFLLFALAAGMLRVTGRESGNPLVKAVVDGASEGTLITDARGRVVYANAAYLELIGAAETRRTPGRSSGPSSATLGFRRRSIGCSRRRAKAAACRRRCASARIAAKWDAGCACGCGRSAPASANLA